MKTRQEKIQLADHAQKILGNPAWKQITTELMTSYGMSWSDCTDPVVREDLWFKQNALLEVIGEIETAITNGSMALETPEEA